MKELGGSDPVKTKTDDGWERSVPYLHLNGQTVSRLFRRFDSGIRSIRLTPLTEGKRTTNYRVSAGGPATGGEERSFLLRIFVPGDDSWRREAALRERLGGRVPMQRLLHMDRDDAIGDRTYAIYEYAEGDTLLKLLLAGYVPEEALFRELGEAAAVIHGHRYERTGFLDGKLDVESEPPPLAQWYGMFLNGNARRRLGDELTARIERLVAAHRDLLDRLDRDPALVHGDFRPANVLVRDGKLSCVLDWEFAMAGHPIADIGQLFRYEEQFSPRLKATFAAAYNRHSAGRLPDDWERIGQLRDLANLLQMIGPDADMPVKFDDLWRLIAGTAAVTKRQNGSHAEDVTTS